MDFGSEGFESSEPLLHGVPLSAINEDWQARVGDGLLQRDEFLCPLASHRARLFRAVTLDFIGLGKLTVAASARDFVRDR